MARVLEETIITSTAEALQAFTEETVMALDIETSGLSFQADQIAVVSLYGEATKKTAILHVQGRLSPSLIDFLSSRRLFIFHNGAAFDLLFLCKAGVDVAQPLWYDTLIAESLTIASARKDLKIGLKAAIKRRLGIELLKDQGLSTWMGGPLTPAQLRYCREDVMYLPRLRAAQLKAMGPEQLRALEYEHQLLPFIVQLSMKGLPFDRSKLSDTTAHFESQTQWAKEHITTVLGPINILSPSQLTNSIQAALNYKLGSTTLESCQAMSEEPGAVGVLGRALVIFKQILAKDQTIDNFWVDKHVINERVYPRYRQVDREDGHLTHNEPDLSLINSECRALFGGLPNHSMVSFTFGNLWWGVMAHLSRDPLMQHLLKEDLARGIHTLMTGSIPPTDDDLRVAASLARAALFGHPVNKLERQMRALGLTKTMEEVEQYKVRFLKTFPGLAKLHAQAKLQAALPAVPISFPTGMRRVLAKAQPYEIVSLRAKGTVGAVVKEGILQLARGGMDPHLHAVVSEEFLFVLPNSLVESVSKELEACLSKAAEKTLGFSLPIRKRVGSHWQ